MEYINIYIYGNHHPKHPEWSHCHIEMTRMIAMICGLRFEWFGLCHSPRGSIQSLWTVDGDSFAMFCIPEYESREAVPASRF